MKTLMILVAAMTAMPASAYFSERGYQGVWIIENYYGQVIVAGAEIGRKIFYCDGRIEIEGQVTNESRLEYVGNC